jgi:hypothetical protein
MKTQRDYLQPAASALGPPGPTAERSVHAFLQHAPVSKNRALQAVPVRPECASCERELRGNMAILEIARAVSLGC